jgi:ribosome maturation factor RimP
MQREGDMKLDQELERQLAALVADEGLELLATEVVGSGPRMVLRLVIDGPGGVTLDHCSAVSRQASAMLDVEDPISHAYTLEVSSPGLDRKLYSKRDYELFGGHRVKVRMRPSYRAHRVLSGTLKGLRGDSVQLQLDTQEVVELPFDEVFEARLEVDWDAIMKEGNSAP